MLVLVLISYFYFTSAKLILAVNEYDHGIEHGNADLDRIWVLPLTEQDYESMVIRLATPEEYAEYNKTATSIIKRLNTFETSHVPHFKKDEVVPYKALNEAKSDHFKLKQAKKQFKSLRMEISKLVNKFALSITAEPNELQNENVEGGLANPEIRVFFNGPYASIKVQLGSRMKQYFAYPSPFPIWFHEIKYNGSTNINVPEIYRNEFLKTLLNLLGTYLGYIL